MAEGQTSYPLTAGIGVEVDEGRKRSGHPRFFELLDEAADLHERKNAGYAGQGNADPLANFRESERLGIPAFMGAMVRRGDKYSRSCNLAKDPSNEQVGEDITETLRDAAAYEYLIICLFEEDTERNVRFLELLKWLNDQLEREYPKDRVR